MMRVCLSSQGPKGASESKREILATKTMAPGPPCSQLRHPSESIKQDGSL